MKAKPAPRAIAPLLVRRAARLPDDVGPRGVLRFGAYTALPCMLGRGGVSRAKREGDGATPGGATMRLLHGYFRAERLKRPRCRVPLRPARTDDGWCDDPRSPLYNRPIRLPAPAGHETMRRDDGLYDIVVVLDWNVGPVRKGRGSAIFLHCAKPAGSTGCHALKPTLGCVALRPGDLARLLPRLVNGATLTVV